MSVAIVTGGASGIGAACAERFAAEGFEVASLDLLEPSAGRARILDLRCDVADEASVADAVAEAVERLGPPRALVNCAGVFPPTTLETMTVDLYRRTFDINVLGTLLVSQATAPLMEEGGAIVNFASINAFVNAPGQLLYCGAKAAVVALTRGLAAELGPRLRVNAVAPGWVDTPGNRATGRMEAAIPRIPLRRVAAPEEIADAVYLLGGEGRLEYMTGETVMIGGGIAFR